MLDSSGADTAFVAEFLEHAGVLAEFLRQIPRLPD